MGFSEEYRGIFLLPSVARESQTVISEDVVQEIWYEQHFCTKNLRTTQGQRIGVVSPGWWSRGEGPDFRDAQVEINGRLRTGDVEVHLGQGMWTQHGHHRDPRYDNVILEVLLHPPSSLHQPATSSGRPIPSLALSPYIDDIEALAETLPKGDISRLSLEMPGQCAAYAEANGPDTIAQLIRLAGEWRLLNKSQRLQEHMERMGKDQAIYEEFLIACGYSRFKHHFGAVARHLPYERARQLSQRDPLLLEAAFLQIAGLLPAVPPTGQNLHAHYKRLSCLAQTDLSGLRALPLEWTRTGVRPNNYPERRFAGAARFIVKTAQEGLWNSLDALWRKDYKTPIARRKAFEELFPNAMGFWTQHCTWEGRQLAKATAPLGSGRIRSIIGNVFVAAALADARLRKDRRLEETVFAFFSALPKEPANHVDAAMVSRFFGDTRAPRLSFGMQQGLLQLYRDWCELNPSCRNCPVLPFLNTHSGPPGTCR